MAFVKFKIMLTTREALVNVDNVQWVEEYQHDCTTLVLARTSIVVEGTFDEVMRRLGDATDVYIDERAPTEAPDIHPPHWTDRCECTHILREHGSTADGCVVRGCNCELFAHDVAALA